MVLLVSEDLTEIDDCEDTTGWAGGIEQFAVETGGVNVEGSGSLCAWIDATTSDDEYHALPSSVDMSSGTHIYVWMMCTGIVDTKTNGGYRIVLYTDTSNYATFYVGGNDTHPTGWNLLCCDASATPDAETGTFDNTDVNYVGIQFKTLTNAIKKGQTYVQNCFWDVLRYGTGLTITSASTDDIELSDIFDDDDDSTNKFGVVQKVYGAYIVTGELIFGDTSGTLTIDFEATNEVVLFQENDLVSATFNSFLVLANSTGTTNFEMSGCFLSGNGVTEFVFDASDADIDIMDLTGCTFKLCDSIILPADATNRIVDGCVFTSCGQVEVDTCEVVNCKWDDSEAPLISSTSHQLSDAIIQNQAYGIEFDTAGTYALSNVVFNNIATAHINNTSGGTVIINCSGTTNASTYTGTTTINNVKTLTLTGLISGSEVRAYIGTDPDTSTELDGVESSGTSFDIDHEEGGNDGYIIIHKEDYESIYLPITYPSSDGEIPIQQDFDRNYENPT